MKYYSEQTKKFYDTAAECEKAENELKLALVKKEAEAAERAAARKADAEKVENAFKAYVEAGKAYEKELTNFCNKHGAYHKTVKSEDIGNTWKNINDLINFFF